MNLKMAFTLIALAFSTHVWADQNFSLEVSKNSAQEWHFNRLMAHKETGQVKVSGRLTSFKQGALPRGHVDIAAYTPSGQLITETTAYHLPALLTRRVKRRGGSQFSATLDKQLPSGALIKVAFHTEKPSFEIKPNHARNIAQ